MSSENRAASALARHYPGGTTAFVRAMNARAKSLGMNHTHYYDRNGLPRENGSTAQDLVHLVNAVQDWKRVVSGKRVSVRVDFGGSRIIKQKTTNKIQQV